MEKTSLTRSNIFTLGFLLVLTLFLRLWNLTEFQYWSDDDQLFWSIVRHIAIDKHPSLVAPNVATSTALGAIFHYLASIWMWTVNFNPLKIHFLGNLFAVASVIALFMAGKIIGGTKTGFTAGFLYATSFLASLFDRRFWPLSPNVFLVTLGVISLIKIVKGDSRYFPVLAIPIGLAFNSDPTLAIMIPAVVFVLLVIRPKIKKIHLWAFVGILFIFLLPILLFDIRHKGENIKSLIGFVNQQSKSEDRKVGWETNIIYDQLQHFSYFFAVSPSKNADAYLCFCRLDGHRTIIAPFIILLLLVTFLIHVAKTKNRDELVLICFLGSYFLGIFTFQKILGGTPQLFHSLVMLPVIFLMSSLIVTQNKLLLFPILLLLFLINLQSLAKSGFKYPLWKKMELVKEITAQLPDKENFSLYYSGDVLLAGGGWTALFISSGYVPETGSLYQYWGHPFEAYGLYPKSFSAQEQETIVVLSENPVVARDNKTIDIIKKGNVYAIIYDNRQKWFDATHDVEKLYQPKYFD